MAGVKMGNVWDRSAEFLTDNLPQVLPVALIAFFVPFSVINSMQPLISQSNPGLAIVLELVGLALVLLAVWGSLTLTAMVLDAGDQANRTALRRLVPALVVWVVLFLLTLLLMLPVALTLMVSGVNLVALVQGEMTPIALPVSVGWALGIYVVLALIVTIWLTARLALVNAVIVREGGMFGAVARSWRLTRGLTWQIVGVLVLYWVVSNVAALAARTVFGSIFSLIAGGSGPLGLATVLTSVIVAAVQAGFLVLAPVFTARLYLAIVADRAPA